MSLPVDPQWYKKSWTLDVEDASWVEHTAQEVRFVIQVLQLHGHERVLDMACGYGRHALEFASKGHSVVGVDITPEYIEEARRRATERQIDAEFTCADLREVWFSEEFDVVLNLADGAIGYLENDDENLKIFDLIASALKPGGKHLMGLCNAAFARAHFPRRHWEIGKRSIALADFEWGDANSRMLYRGCTLKYGDTLTEPKPAHPSTTRLYTLEELRDILRARNMVVTGAFGGYDTALSVSDDDFALVVCSKKPI